jgi:hypothetical protein
LPSKFCVNPTDVVSSLSTPRCRFSPGQRCHAAVLCHSSFPWSQDELAASTSSSGNATSHRLPSQAKTKALNLHHHYRPPSPATTIKRSSYRWAPSTTIKSHLIIGHSPHPQPCLHFASSLARAPHHRSSTRCCRSLSPPSHAHHPSA